MNAREKALNARVLDYVYKVVSSISKQVIKLYEHNNIEHINTIRKQFTKAINWIYATYLLSLSEPVKEYHNGDSVVGGFIVLYAGIPFVCKISDRNHKMGRTNSVSKLAGFSCRHCKHCLKFCYVLKSYMVYPDKVKADICNTILFKVMDRFDAWDVFVDAFVTWWKRKRTNTEYFRIDESGDLLSVEELIAWYMIAVRCPETRFYTYTKIKKIFEFYEEQGCLNKLDNLVVRFSPWLGDEENNPDTIKNMSGCGYYLMDLDNNTIHNLAKARGAAICPCINGNTKNACVKCGHKCAYRDITIYERLNA